jgi:AmmeMemoRadiSam system protein A
MPLSSQDRKTLLKLAREAITRAAHGREPPAIDSSALAEDLQRDGASFVTLTKHEQLRGCIGSLEARRSLASDVRENAVAAATSDPRFPPVRPEELDALHIEVSVLSSPQPLSYDGPDDLIAKLRPGVDGVVIERGWNRATFLPQVWEKLPDPHEFLEHLCMKAYLPSDSYRRPGLHVFTYQVEKFEEE